MHLVPTYQLAKESEYAAQHLTGLDDFVVGFKKNVSQLTFFAVSTLFCVPALAYCLVLYNRRRKIYRELKKGFPGFDKPSDYKHFRLTHAKMQERRDKLKRIASYKINEIPYPLRPAVWQFKKVSNALLDVLTAMDAKLAQYNQPNSKQDKKGNSLRFISENELWAKRTTAYEYIM